MNATLRKAEAEDAEEACKVLCRSIQECCHEDHRDDPAILKSWLANKTPENIRSWFQSPGYSIVADLEGRLVGVGMLSAGGRIMLCYIVPEMRFQGLGAKILKKLEHEALKRGLQVLQVGSTKTAHDFYKRNGYRDTNVAKSAFGLKAMEMEKNFNRA